MVQDIEVGMEVLPLRARSKKSASQVMVQTEGLVKLAIEVAIKLNLKQAINESVQVQKSRELQK